MLLFFVKIRLYSRSVQMLYSDFCFVNEKMLKNLFNKIEISLNILYLSKYSLKIYQLHTQQNLPINVDVAWDFLATLKI